MTPNNPRKHLVILCGILALLGITITGYFSYRTIHLQRSLTTTEETLSTTISQSEQKITELESTVATLTEEKTLRDSAFSTTEAKVAEFEKNISDLMTEVVRYKKLTELDPQLLQKYSKVYFLNEHYVPSALQAIDERFVQGKGRTLQIHANVWPFLKEMFEAADAQELALRTTSAYRSFGTQASLKATYKVTYGTSAANRFSADQGYSEHQLGTTLDFTTAKTGDLSGSFDTTPESKWLIEHAHEYGFVLSYPKNNKYYIYEPWHWRFVGRNLATFLHEEQKHLYDLDQRTIDAYLITMFD